MISHGVPVELQLSNLNTWNMVEVADRTPLAIDVQVAKLMAEKFIVADVDLGLIAADMYPLAAVDLQWRVVSPDIVNLQSGLCDINKSEGKQYLCTFVVPNLMRLLYHSANEKPLWTHLMAIPFPIRGFLLYLVVKMTVSTKKLKDWRDFLSDRMLQAVVRKNAVMEGDIERMKIGWTGVVDAGPVQMEEDNRIAEIIEAGRSSAEKQAELQEKIDSLAEHQRIDREAVSKLAESHTALSGKQVIDRAMVNMLSKGLTKFADVYNKLSDDHEQLLINQNMICRKVETHDGQLDDLHEQATTVMDNAIDRIGKLLDQKFSNHLSLSDKPPCPLPVPSPFLFLRLRNCTEAAEDAIVDPNTYRRIWSAGEENKIVSRAVTACFSTPFIIVLMGYSGAGKSYTAFRPHGLLAGILSRLPSTSLEVTEVLNHNQSLGSYLFPEQSAEVIMASISSRCLTADHDSSRRHLVIQFVNIESGLPFGLLIDIAGPDQSDNFGQPDQDMGHDSMKILSDNICIRQLLQKFVAGDDYTLLKDSSKLNRLVVDFVKVASVVAPVAVRVVLCGDGRSVEMVNKTMGMVPEFKSNI